MMIANKIAPSAEAPNVALLAPIRTRSRQRGRADNGLAPLFEIGASFLLADLAVAISAAGEPGSAEARAITETH